MLQFSTGIAFLFLYYSVLTEAQSPTNEEIRDISDQIWQGDLNRIDGDDVQYNVQGAKLFTYVNEARFTGTYARMIDLLDNYTPETGIPESCGILCRNEEEAFLDAVLPTRPMQLLHSWLYGKGLAGQTLAEFKEELRQYFFMPYARSAGRPLESSGFEHVFVGEINNNAVSGFHNWVQAYLSEKAGDFVYGSYLGMCPNEVLKLQFGWLGYNKPISSFFIRTSPEVEMALYTLCLTTRIGTSCPVRRNGVDLTMTAWDMTGLPKTIGTAYPNC